MVSIVLAQERPVRRAERLAERIQQILNERGRVEQVKGILAAHMDITPAQAYAGWPTTRERTTCSWWRPPPA